MVASIINVYASSRVDRVMGWVICASARVCIARIAQVLRVFRFGGVRGS